MMMDDFLLNSTSQKVNIGHCSLLNTFCHTRLKLLQGKVHLIWKYLDQGLNLHVMKPVIKCVCILSLFDF